MHIQYNRRDAARVLISLLCFELILVGAYVLVHIIGGADASWGPARPWFNLDRELSIPTWFSSMQLLATSVLLLLASRINQREQHLPSWLLLLGSAGFAFLSVDEGAAIHERLTGIAENMELNWLIFKGGHGAWIPIYVSIAVGIALVSARPLYSAWIHFRREMLIALGGGALLILGGIGFEILSYLFIRSEAMTNTYRIEVALEEFFEMSGVSIILYAVMLFGCALSTPDSEEGVASNTGADG